ncbi:MAG: rhomboid family intramembrane serine protease [Sediminibacterium sp.]
MTEFRPSRFQILPTIVKNLLIINGLVFLAQNTMQGLEGFSIDDTFALHAWQSNLFKPWQLVTHLFMHGGNLFKLEISHIFFNMLALWMFGSVLENVWGSKRFLTFYMVCGLGAALIHLLFLSWELAPIINDYTALAQQHMAGSEYEADAMVRFMQKYHLQADNTETVTLLQNIRANAQNPVFMDSMFNEITQFYHTSKIDTATIGASGAVFGVLAAFGYLFPNTYLYIYMLVPVKAKWVVLFYGAIELFEGIQNSAGDNVAHWAHIGGAVVGLLIVMTWNKTNKKTLY